MLARDIGDLKKVVRALTNKGAGFAGDRAADPFDDVGRTPPPLVVPSRPGFRVLASPQ
jgi:hypothetical protein